MLGHADVHVHTKYSGVTEHGILKFPESVSNPNDVVKIAKRVNLDIVCITDHNSILGAVKAKSFAKEHDCVEVVVGEEISTADGEIIGLFLNELVPPGLSVEETVDLVRQQDGMLVAPHPFSYHVPALGLLVDDIDLDGIEVINGGHIDGPANDRAMEHSRSGRWARSDRSGSKTATSTRSTGLWPGPASRLACAEPPGERSSASRHRRPPGPICSGARR